jgi:UDP-GlcNAc:undecaprenyl-phosphate/decaprenyl-phosphate GlcNAc-1-phosphate transferase
MSNLMTSAAAFPAAFAVTAGLTTACICICRSRGWVSRPRPDRWHKGAPAFFGGVPIFLGVVVLSAAFLPASAHLVWKIVGISSLMFLLGLADDIFHLRPWPKLLAQVAAAALALHCGIVYPVHASVVVSLGVSLLWIVGITNAFNLLDNMDGLSPGVALIASLSLFILSVGSGHPMQALLAAVTAGSIGGFLLFNFHPARIFMGDSGSLFLGFLLGTTSLLQGTHRIGVSTLIFAPVMVLAIPILDTFFVSVSRRMRGQPISQGGTDHSSHRLVRLGIGERTAVLLLYLLSGLSGGLAILVPRLSHLHALEIAGLWFFFLFVFGLHLFHGEQEAQMAHPAGLNRLPSWDALVFVLDPVALFLSFLLAYFLRFPDLAPAPDNLLFYLLWPVVVGVKFVGLWLCGIYRYSWWRGSATDIYQLGRATICGELGVGLLLLILGRVQDSFAMALVLDAVCSWILLLCLRYSFLIFRESMQRLTSQPMPERQVLVLGTSEHSALAVRFLKDRRVRCTGLIDTNGGGDVGRYVWGAYVLGRLENIASLVSRLGVSEVVLPADTALPCSEHEVEELCRSAHVRLSKLGLYAGESDGNAKASQRAN